MTNPQDTGQRQTASQDQSAVIAFLRSGAGLSGGDPVEVVETHGALVFLWGETAVKIKRAVKYDYMDLTSLATREAMVRRELELNKSTAPEIYQDVLPITLTAAGEMKLGGDGVPVEWALRMWRFPAQDELVNIAARGGLDDALAEQLGHAIARYHAACPIRHRDGAALIEAILDELERVFSGMAAQLGEARTGAFLSASREALERHRTGLARRGLAGHVRRAHGDLHLHNIVLIAGRPTLFDALEFDETLGTCDVLYDLAFLLMDISHKGFAAAANAVLSTYLLEAVGAEDAGLFSLPLFLAVRGAIRAMVLVQTDEARGLAGESSQEARGYLDEACAVLDPAPVCLVAVGGVSGTGKSTLAKAMAPEIGPRPGAVLLRSDTQRKAQPVPPDPYAAAARRQVYDWMFERAVTILNAGRSAVLDATFLDAEMRDTARQLARRTGVPFRGLWLTAPDATLIERVSSRRGDASQADATVVRKQLARGPFVHDWTVVEAGRAPDQTLRAALAAVSPAGCL
jgi:uncharacterized protein